MVSEIVKKLLKARGIAEEEDFAAFLNPSLSDIGEAEELPGVSKAAEVILSAVAAIGQAMPSDWRSKKGSGFGLLNCKGIIDKYRKTDALFEVCRFGIDSKVGEGSRFWFRLPKGVRRLMMLLCITTLSLPMLAATSSPYLAGSDTSSSYSPLLEQASAFADSVYFANVDGRYSEALVFAASIS